MPRARGNDNTAAAPTRDRLAPRLGRMEQLAAIRRLTLDDGPGRGMRVLDVDTGGGLAFSVLPDRGMDIERAAYRGTPLAWLARNPPAAPAFHEPAGEGWLRTCGGGLLIGCGLTNVGPAGTAADGEQEGMHGRLSHIPAEEVNTFAGWDANGRYMLRLEGRMRQGRVFGENLVLTRRMTAFLGEAALTIRDTVENQGFRPSPCMLLYHVNLGWPLLDEGAGLEAPPHEVTPRDAAAAAGLKEWARMTAPQPGAVEQVFYHALPADVAGLASVRLANPRLGLAFVVTWRPAELPWLVQWKMMGEGDYVLGLEPANCLPEGREHCARRGLLRMLAAGERFETFLRLAVEELRAAP
jgi:hypothetical protein